ncbi:nucleotidyltransferase family protein [Marinimicrobium sp. C2-29]|uniref:nucleotidyltransferase family protein n=1 Tax=Marinimicrobium sp. C2-29 TaxID=3139825 RepID=UPI0031396E33
MRSDDIVGLIMAAGYSTRFGSDKRSATLADGQTLLQATTAMAQPLFHETYVVIRAGDNAAALELNSEAIIRAPETPIGLGTSIGVAFQHLLTHSHRATAAAVLLGDMPWIKPDAFATLLPKATENTIVRPIYDGNAGHPVIFGRQFWPELAGLQGDMGARTIIQKHHNACRLITVADVGVLRDVDRPDDLVMS